MTTFAGILAERADERDDLGEDGFADSGHQLR